MTDRTHEKAHENTHEKTDALVKGILAWYEECTGFRLLSVTIWRGCPGEGMAEAYRRAGIDVELVG